MSIESISQRFRIYPPSNKEDYEQWLSNMAGRMYKAMYKAFLSGANCGAEIEGLLDATNGVGGDLLQELERCESWLQNHWDKKTNEMDLTITQKEAIKKMIAARRQLERSGLKLVVIDDSLCLYNKNDNVNFDNFNDIDSYIVTKFGFLDTYGT